MRRIRSAAIQLALIALACGGSLQLAAAQEPARLYWDELKPVIVNENISIDLPDGAHLVGIVHDVWPDALALDVEWTSDPVNYPTEHRSIPRASVSQFELRTKRVDDSNARVGRKLGFLGGLLVGEALGLAIASDGHPHLGLMVFTGATVGGALLGDQLGTRTEINTSLVIVIPEPPRARPAPAPAPSANVVPGSHVAATAQVARSPLELPPGASGRRLVRRAPRPKPKPDTWPVSPSRSRENWAL